MNLLEPREPQKDIIVSPRAERVKFRGCNLQITITAESTGDVGNSLQEPHRLNHSLISEALKMGSSTSGVGLPFSFPSIWINSIYKYLEIHPKVSSPWVLGNPSIQWARQDIINQQCHIDPAGFCCVMADLGGCLTYMIIEGHWFRSGALWSHHPLNSAFGVSMSSLTSLCGVNGTEGYCGFLAPLRTAYLQ